MSQGLEDGIAPLRITFVSDLTYNRIEYASGGPVLGWMYEPPRVCPWCIEFIRAHLPHFDMFVSHHPPLLSLDSGAMRFCPIAQSYVPHALRRVYPKTKNVSIVASAKVRLQGHRLRHKVIDRYRCDVSHPPSCLPSTRAPRRNGADGFGGCRVPRIWG